MGRVVAAKATAAPITLFDATPLPVGFACEVVDLDVEGRIGPREARRIDRSGHLALIAAADALADAGLSGAVGEGLDAGRVAVVAGTGIGGLTTLEEQVRLHAERGPEKGPRRVSPMLVPDDDGQRAGRPGGHRPRLHRPVPVRGHRLRHRRQRHRRGVPAAARRHRRRRGRRGHRVRHHPHGHGRLRQHGRPQQAVRRPGHRQPALRRRPRRLRDGRGRRLPRPGGLGPRRGPRAPASTASCWATAPPATPATSPLPPRTAPGPPSASGAPWRRPGSTRPTSATSTPTARPRRSTTRPRPGPSAPCSAPAPCR